MVLCFVQNHRFKMNVFGRTSCQMNAFHILNVHRTYSSTDGSASATSLIEQIMAHVGRGPRCLWGVLCGDSGACWKDSGGILCASGWIWGGFWSDSGRILEGFLGGMAGFWVTLGGSGMDSGRILDGVWWSL